MAVGTTTGDRFAVMRFLLIKVFFFCSFQFLLILMHSTKQLWVPCPLPAVVRLHVAFVMDDYFAVDTKHTEEKERHRDSVMGWRGIFCEIKKHGRLCNEKCIASSLVLVVWRLEARLDYLSTLQRKASSDFVAFFIYIPVRSYHLKNERSDWRWLAWSAFSMWEVLECNSPSWYCKAFFKILLLNACSGSLLGTLMTHTLQFAGEVPEELLLEVGSPWASAVHG